MKDKIKDEIVSKAIDKLSEDPVKLAEFKAGFIDHVYLMELAVDEAEKYFVNLAKNEPNHSEQDTKGSPRNHADRSAHNSTQNKGIGSYKI